jgi:hypothetical protein
MNTQDVEQIKRMLMNGDHPSMIALVYDVSVDVVYEIMELLYENSSEEFSPFQTINS